MKNIGLLGARGFVGKEIIRLVLNHPFFEIGSVSPIHWLVSR